MLGCVLILVNDIYAFLWLFAITSTVHFSVLHSINSHKNVFMTQVGTALCTHEIGVKWLNSSSFMFLFSLQTVTYPWIKVYGITTLASDDKLWMNWVGCKQMKINVWLWGWVSVLVKLQSCPLGDFAGFETTNKEGHIVGVFYGAESI